MPAPTGRPVGRVVLGVAGGIAAYKAVEVCRRLMDAGVYVMPVLTGAKVGGLSIEFANPRHQHEYAALKKAKLPADLILLPGVIDTSTNYVEHPEVVANRICEAVDAVGDRTRVIASSDCGFGTFAGSEMVAEDVVWAKLKACRDGADIATKRLWGR